MQKCSTTLNWFLNTQKKSILCNFIMKRHPETHSCRVNAHHLPHEWTPWTAGVGAPPSIAYTPLLILSPGCHVPISAILATAWHSCVHRSCKGEVKIRKNSPRHEFLLELGGNSPSPVLAISHNLTPWGSTSPRSQQKRPPCIFFPSPPQRQLSPSPPALLPVGTRVCVAGWQTTSWPRARTQLVILFPLAEISAGSIPLLFRLGLHKLEGEDRNGQVREAALCLLAPILANVSLKI